MNPTVLHVAVPSPLRRRFDYLAPATVPPAGTRVQVPFGRRQVVGVVLGSGGESDVPVDKLRPISKVLDEHPLLPTPLLELLNWAAAYYHHPIGEVYTAALPVALRQGQPPQVRGQRRYRLSAEGTTADPNTLKRAPRQAQLLARLQQLAGPIGSTELVEL